MLAERNYGSQDDRPVAQTPRTITDVVAACGPTADAHAALISHLLALVDAAGFIRNPAEPVNETLARFAFSSSGQRVTQSRAPWLQGGLLRELSEDLAAAEDSEFDETPRFRPNRIFDIGDCTVMVYTQTSWSVCGPASAGAVADHAYHRRRDWCWFQFPALGVFEVRPRTALQQLMDEAGEDGQVTPVALTDKEYAALTKLANTDCWVTHG